VQGSAVKTIFYIDGSPYTATVALENNNGTTRLLYIHRDNIGSITHITNASKALQAEYSYDAWGRMRNPANLVVYTLGTEPVLLLNRGYTGHEHLREFSLINMNARLYDPITARMLSPDNYVQKPGDAMNFNRYSYALNNPLRYNDPSGNIILEFIIGFIDGFFKSGSNRWDNAWRGGVEKAENTRKLIHGQIAGSLGQFYSRHTWETFQNGIGLGTSWWMALTHRDVNVEFFDGATVVHSDNFKNVIGVTIGSYIIGNDVKVFKDDGNFGETFMHEYGHYIQSQKSGPLYLYKYGVPSALTKKESHKEFWVEMDANNRAFDYFSQYTNVAPWNRTDYPIGDIHDVKWWEPFVYAVDPLAIIRMSRTQ
jgi:RHS repeat-associated protein